MLRRTVVSLILIWSLERCCSLDVPPIPDPSTEGQQFFSLQWQTPTPDPTLSLRNFFPQVTALPDGTFAFAAQFVRTASDGTIKGELYLYRIKPDGVIERALVYGYPVQNGASSTAILLSNFHLIADGATAWPVQHPMPGPSGASSLARIATPDAVYYSAYTLGIGAPPPRILKTTNRGTAWKTILVGTQSDKLNPWLDLAAQGQTIAAFRSRFWGMVPYSELYVSRDGGKTWAPPVAMPTQSELRFGSASLTADGYLAACDFWAGGTPPYLMVSTLTGSLVARTSIACSTTSFVSRDTGIFATPTEVRRTDNAGVNSTVIFTAPAGENVQAVRALTRDRYIAVVQKASSPFTATVYRTEDRGATWTVLLSLA
jgi:hypothetical protein